MQQKQESWQPLGAGYWAKVSREHRFSTDTLLLSHFSTPQMCIRDRPSVLLTGKVI